MAKKKSKKRTSRRSQTRPAPLPNAHVQEPPLQRQELPRLSRRDVEDMSEEDLQAEVDRRMAAETQTQRAAQAAEELGRRRAAAERTAREQQQRAQQFWPDGEDLPDHYIRRRLQPCPECRRVLTAAGGQAVVCTASRNDEAYLRCKSCGHSWAMPVKQV
jgi:hypothetical protein